MEWLCRDIESFSGEALQQAMEQLTPSRKEHILRLRRQEDRNRSLAGELLVQQLLRAHFGIADAAVHRDAAGKPYLTGCDLHISIAHADQKVACAVSKIPVGIDIERIRPIKRRLIHHVCVEEEARYVLGENQEETIQDPEALRRFFGVWTAKEAYFKKQGTGITDLKSVNILHLERQMHCIDGYILHIL